MLAKVAFICGLLVQLFVDVAFVIVLCMCVCVSLFLVTCSAGVVLGVVLSLPPRECL